MRRIILALLALALAAIHCGAPQLPPSDPPPPTNNAIGRNNVVRLIGQTPSEMSDFEAGLAAGRLFLVRKEDDKLTWVNCGNVIVKYGWRGSGKYLEHFDAENEPHFRAKLPFASTTSLGAEFAQGNLVRVWIASAGSFHVDEDQVSVSPDCKATHYVSSITVGAYSITSVSPSAAVTSASGPGGMGAGGRVAARKLQGSEQGELEKCAGDEQGDGPPDACRTPVEIVLGWIDRSMRRPQSGASPAPPPTPCASCGMPRPLPERSCLQLVRHTGDVTTDINAVGEACGTKLGLVAVASPYSRKLSQDQGWQKQFELELDVACYRIFGVGDAGIQRLDIGVKDASGAVIAEDSSSGPMAALNPDGPFCIQRAQKVQLWVRVGKGAGAYAMWLWKKK